MHRTYERGIKARLSFSSGLHAHVNTVDDMEEVNVGIKKLRKRTFATLNGAKFRSGYPAATRGLRSARETKSRFGVALERICRWDINVTDWEPRRDISSFSSDG